MDTEQTDERTELHRKIRWQMTKAEASMKIDELREKTGTGEAPKKRKARKA